MIILGISAFFHDSSAAIIKDGILIAAAEEERFTRKKHDFGFPFKAIEYCLKEAGIKIDQVNSIAFYEKPLLKFDRIITQFIDSFPRGFLAFNKTMPSWLNEKLRIRGIIKNKLKFKGEVYFIEHHLAHSASSYLVSPFNESVILTLDGVGEWASSTCGYAKGNEIKLEKEIRFPHSLGLLYSTVTAFIGMSVNNSEYKCLHPETPIYLNNGKLINIEKLFNLKGKLEKISDDEDILNLKNPIYVNSLNKINLKLRISKVTQLYRKKANTKLYKIELLSGRKVIVTPNHKFSSVDLYGNFMVNEAINLKGGDFIIIPKRISLNNFNKNYKYWAYLLAYSIAESHEFIRKEKSEAEIRLGCVDKEIIDDFKFVVLKLNKKFRTWIDKNDLNMLFVATSVWKDLDFMNNKLCYEFGKYAPEKCIPDFIMQSDKIIQKGFLERLFNCDGGFVGHQLIYASASPKLINSLSYMLMNFGVHSRIRKVYNKKYKRYYYRIEINGKWLKIFDENIGFTLKRKDFKLKEYIKSIDKFGNNNDFVPINDLILKNWLNLGKPKNSLYKKLGRHYWDFATNNLLYKSYPTPTFIEKYYNLTKFKELKKFVNNDIFFDQIKLIEKVDFNGYVYDLLVPYDNTFIGGYGGIVLHNTMGLSAYGIPKYIDKFKKIMDVKEDGSFALDMSYFEYHYKMAMPSKKFYELFCPPRNKNGEITQEYKDITASLQKFTEEIIFKILNNLHKKYKIDNLCMAGGVALNSLANGKIIKNTPFKRVFIQPAAGDGGTSLGAAFYVYNTLLKNERKYIMKEAYLGPEYSNLEIKKFLEDNQIKYKKFENDEELIKETAKLIYENSVIGWFQGRMEFGPRALGSRSILSNPCNPKMQEILNLKVKHREKFRPFAPAVCIDDAKKYFECDKEIPLLADFMLLVYPIKDKYKKLIPAVVHVDGTGRLQTVRREQNKRYYDLIKEFGKLSGIPILINTSFNIRGEPIVCTPYESYRCMMGTGIDYLLLGDYLVKRSDNLIDIWDSEKYADD